MWHVACDMTSAMILLISDCDLRLIQYQCDVTHLADGIHDCCLSLNTTTIIASPLQELCHYAPVTNSGKDSSPRRTVSLNHPPTDMTRDRGSLWRALLKISQPALLTGLGNTQMSWLSSSLAFWVFPQQKKGRMWFHTYSRMDTRSWAIGCRYSSWLALYQSGPGTWGLSSLSYLQILRSTEWTCKVDHDGMMNTHTRWESRVHVCVLTFLP